MQHAVVDLDLLDVVNASVVVLSMVPASHIMLCKGAQH